MKKLLLLVSFLMLNTCFSRAFAVNYYQAPNAGNLNFYPLMQHQMEKQETLDFKNDPENYKQKREAKNAQLDYQEGKTNSLPPYKPATFNLDSTRDRIPPENTMEFTKDSNGQIIIKGIE